MTDPDPDPDPDPGTDADPGDATGPGAAVPRRGRRREGFTLDRFLKYEGLAETGGMAKRLVEDGLVRVNGEPESRKRRQLAPGDVVEVDGERRVVPGRGGG